MATGLVQGAEEAPKGKAVKIIRVACSPRKGMTTAKAVQAALDAAKGADARIEVELIDLGGLSIAGYSPKPRCGWRPRERSTAVTRNGGASGTEARREPPCPLIWATSKKGGSGV